jgi:RHS repeat-associated protein
MQLLNSPVALPTVPNKQLYNGGSEWQNDYSNLPDYYQTFNRNYDAALGRFIGVDPKAESAESMTSYQYAGNNPIMFNDPLGDLLPMPGSHTPPPSNYNPLGGSATDDVNIAPDFANQTPGGAGDVVDGGDYSAYWDNFLAENGLTVDKGPAAFSVDRDGCISYEPDLQVVGGNKDVLLSLDNDSNLDLSNARISVDQGALGHFLLNDVPIRGTDVISNNFNLGNNAEAKSVFEFLSNHTDVEWGLVRYNGTQNIITTDHRVGSISSSTGLADVLINQFHYTVNEIIHDHPPIDFNTHHGPSGYVREDSSFGQANTDLTNYQRFNSTLPNIIQNVIFKVYDVSNNTYYQYGDGYNYFPISN